MFLAHRKHPRRELLRALLVAITALAWLYPSLRCAMGCAVPLGSALPACCAPAAPSGTPLAPASGIEKGGSEGGDVCREVRAEYSKHEFERIILAPVVVGVWDLNALLTAPPPRVALTAPAASPPASSFAERVLQESLFAHAPPHSR